jgi:hypothetical protein
MRLRGPACLNRVRLSLAFVRPKCVRQAKIPHGPGEAQILDRIFFDFAAFSPAK